MKHRVLLVVFPFFVSTVVVFLLYVGLLRFNYPSHTEFPVRGIDVSHHQGPIDWRAVAAEGITFAFIKATEGRDFLDPRFHENWDACNAAELACGAYHFFTYCTPGRDQARHFLDTVDTRVPQLPLVVDVEFTGNCRNHPDSQSIARELRDLVDELESATGDRPLLYVAGKAYDEIVRDNFGEYPIWRRNIFFQPDGAGHLWRFWQFSNRGRRTGIDGFVDLNVFCCSLEELPFLEDREAGP